jgi:hypothetical protein
MVLVLPRISRPDSPWRRLSYEMNFLRFFATLAPARIDFNVRSGSPSYELDPPAEHDVRLLIPNRRRNLE